MPERVQKGDHLKDLVRDRQPGASKPGSSLHELRTPTVQYSVHLAGSRRARRRSNFSGLIAHPALVRNAKLCGRLICPRGEEYIKLCNQPCVQPLLLTAFLLNSPECSNLYPDYLDSCELVRLREIAGFFRFPRSLARFAAREAT